MGHTKSGLRVQTSIASKFSRHVRYGPRNVVRVGVKKTLKPNKQKPKPYPFQNPTKD